MTADPVLTLAWLALAHLVADFLVQTDRVAADKFGGGAAASRAMLWHGAGVAACLVPIALAFGVPGIVVLVVVPVVHIGIDWLKVVWTRHVEARAIAEAHAMREPPAPEASLGTAWTPLPAALFALDQLAHAVVLLGVWAVGLATAPVNGTFGDVVGGLAGHPDPVTMHRVVLTAVVLAALAVVNIRAAALFVATLVRPREEVTGQPDPGGAAAAVTPTPTADGTPPPEPSAADVAPPAAGPASAPDRAAVPAGHSSATPARVGATIGVLERLLIVAFILTGAAAATGLVVAAKTLARFKQLDDRQFAEYYLLGTLASVAVAIGSALVAAAALASIHP